MLRRAPERQGRATRSTTRAKPAVELPPEVQPVFEALRAWRGDIARSHGVPAYVIFHDATLRDIALASPGSLDELAQINGVGARKLQAYGEDILQRVARPLV